MSKRHYMVIKYSVGRDGTVEMGPAFGHRQGDTWFHCHGPTRMGWPKEVEVLADYGLVDSRDYDMQDNLECRFAKDFPWPSGMAIGGGYLSPDGIFYPCGPWEHTSALYHLGLAIYGSTETIYKLEGITWIKLYDEFVAVRKETELSQAQIDTLGELQILDGQNEKLRKSIRNLLRQTP